MKSFVLKFLSVLLALMFVLPFPAAAASDPACGCPTGTPGAFYKGSGSEPNPFRITNEAQLRHMEAHPDGHFRLDRSLKPNSWSPLCQDTPFTGSLDGRGKALTLSAPLFGKIGESGYVHDLTLKGEIAAEAGGLYTGFAARENAGRIGEISVSGTLSATEGTVGGIVGRNTGFIESCAFTGTLETAAGVTAGAIAGLNEPSPTLPAIVTAHSGFAAKRGASDKREDNTLDNIIKSVCLRPDAIEVDVRIYTDPQGNQTAVLAHDKEMVGPDCPTVEEVLKLLMGDHPRCAELTENYKTVLIQLDQKEPEVAKIVFALIEQLGFPLERVIFPVGAPTSVEEDLAFWQELSAKGLQIWVTPDQRYYDDIAAYTDFLDTLGIPVVVNMYFGDATPEKIAHLKEHGYGTSVWTLNTHDDIVENMAIGAFNVTSRLEEVLAVREGFRTGILECRWDPDLPVIGTGIPAPQGAQALPQPQEKEPVWIVPAVLGILAAISLFFTFRKKRKNK